MTNPTTPSVPVPANTVPRPRSNQTGATQNRPAPAKSHDSSLSWKSAILAAGVGITLLGNTLFTRIERANAAAEAAQSAQATAIIRAVQVLEAAKASRTAQFAAAAQAAQANSMDQPRTIIVRVPVSISGGQPVVNQAGGQAGGQPSGQPSGEPSGQPASQPSQVAFASAPAVPAIVMPAMPVAPVFQAPVTVTRKS